MKLLMIFLTMLLVSCRPGSEVVDKSTKSETVTYRPGTKIKIDTSNAENTIPLFTADASLICSDLSFYDPNGALIQGTRDCSESLPECEEDGHIDCRATATHPAVPKAELEAKIIAGESLAGVEGAANGSAYSVCTGAGQSACIATTTYQTMDLSPADSSTDLTASNFNATIASAGNFEFWDATGTRHVLSGDSNLTAINIKNGVSLFGISGSLTGAPPNCESDGEGSCLVDGTNYRAAATSGAASKILSGQSVAGISGNVTLPAQGTVLTGTNYGVGGTGSAGSLTLPSAANVLASAGNYGNPSSPVTPSYSPDFPDVGNVLIGDTVNNLSGTLSLPAVGKVLTGTSYGVGGNGSTGTLTLPAASNVLAGSGNYGDPGTPEAPSYNPDFPAVGNVLSSDTVNGANGTLILPNPGDVEAGVSYGVSGNGSTGTFTVPAAANVASGVNYGANGTEFSGSASIESHTDCTGAGQTGCVATATYATMDLSNKDGGGALDLNTTDFNARIKSASLFEYWDENGVRYTANGDANILATNIKSTVDIFGVSGSVAEAPANCSANGSQSCVATGSYYAATACAADASNCFVPSYVATIQPLKAISYDAIDAGKGSIRTSLTLSDITGTLSDCSGGGSTGCVTTATYPSMNLATTGGTGLTNANFAAAVASSSTYEFWDASGARHTVTGDTDLSVGNLKDGIEIHGVTGDYPSATYPLASDTGTTDLTSLGSGTGAGSYEFFDSTGARYATTVADGGTITPTASQQDFSGVSTVYNGFSVAGDADLVGTNIKSGTTIFGVAGSISDAPANCTTNGSQDCVATGTYFAATACASNGSDNCYLNPAGSYDAADLSNLSAGNIKRGITIAGTIGNFPSSTSPLLRYSDSGATTNVSGTDLDDLDSATFTAKLKSSSAFEYWNSAGVRYDDVGDTDIVASNIRSGISILGTTGSMTEQSAQGTPLITSVNASSTSYDSVDLNWSSGGGSENAYLVVRRTSSAVTFAPTDNVTYTVGQNLGNNQYVAYTGTGTSTTVTGLSAGTTYYFKVFPIEQQNYHGTGQESSATTTSCGANGGSFMGVCWYKALSDTQTCDSFCSTRGGANSLTCSYAAASQANCVNVVNAIPHAIYAADSVGGTNGGCSLRDGGGPGWYVRVSVGSCSLSATQGSGSYQVCGCNE